MNAQQSGSQALQPHLHIMPIKIWCNPSGGKSQVALLSSADLLLSILLWVLLCQAPVVIHSFEELPVLYPGYTFTLSNFFTDTEILQKVFFSASLDRFFFSFL